MYSCKSHSGGHVESTGGSEGLGHTDGTVAIVQGGGDGAVDQGRAVEP